MIAWSSAESCFAGAAARIGAAALNDAPGASVALASGREIVTGPKLAVFACATARTGVGGRRSATCCGADCGAGRLLAVGVDWALGCALGAGLSVAAALGLTVSAVGVAVARTGAGVCVGATRGAAGAACVTTCATAALGAAGRTAACAAAACAWLARISGIGVGGGSSTLTIAGSIGCGFGGSKREGCGAIAARCVRLLAGCTRISDAGGGLRDALAVRGATSASPPMRRTIIADNTRKITISATVSKSDTTPTPREEPLGLKDQQMPLPVN